MGGGSASGENRVRDAVRQALATPLAADAPIAEANGALVVITAGPDLTITEIEDVQGIFMNELNNNATILISAAVDETLADEVRITFIATTV